MFVRLLDILVALPAVTVLQPVLRIWARLRGAPARRIAVHGRLGRRLSYLHVRYFRRDSRLAPLNYLGAFGLVLSGKLAITGPRPTWVAQPRPGYAAYAARPGLISVHLLQRRANIAHDERGRVDSAQIRARSLKTHLAILLRFLISLAVGASRSQTPERLSLLDVEIRNMSMTDTLAHLARAARGPGLTQVAFVNPDCLNISRNDAAYRSLLQRLPTVLADGIGIHLAVKWFLGSRLRDNVNGTDLFPRLCRVAAEQGLSLYLLGARPGVAEAVARNAVQRVPGLRIAGVRDGYWQPGEEAEVVESINQSGADILLVAMGVPRQDLWIAGHAEALNVKLAMGVGGLFDFYSGRVARAPVWLREIGLEWAYRLLQEPGRMWRRYVVGNPLFLWRVWRWSRAQGRSSLAASARKPSCDQT
jgi:N-acetylglucosaminyldiphosphoundecaprenol N-acetyl-beta-D-mannosaminyltransferase